MLIETQNPKVNISINRLLYSQNNNIKGNTLICFGGLHGNEPAGINGLNKVIETLETKQIELNGNFYAVRGNVAALEKGVRFIDTDLNRLWTKDNIEALRTNDVFALSETNEQKEILNAITDILQQHDGPFIFVDLHTTSSATIPFMTISDALSNRKLAKAFNIPIVLGIEEFLDGPLLSFINEYGHISIGLEAGQHDDETSAWHCEAYIWLVMEHVGLVDKKAFPFQEFKRLLQVENGFYEIIYRYALKDANGFEMNEGFENFTPITKDQVLAYHNGSAVTSPFNGLIFMPLYQAQGEDGFFVIRKISKPWLVVSTVLRSLKFHQLLRLLPGIHKHPENDFCLIADRRVARFLTTKVFHLFGYRKKIVKGDKIHFIKRDRKVTNLL